MHNLSIVQEAWLAAQAPSGEPTIDLAGAVSIAMPEPGFPGYCVMSLSHRAVTFGDFASAMDFAATIV